MIIWSVIPLYVYFWSTNSVYQSHIIKFGTVIIQIIPLTFFSDHGMVETILLDDVSEVSLLCDHQVGEARVASGAYGGIFNTTSTCTNQEESNAVTKTTNCPLC